MKKIFTITILLILIAGVTATAALFLFPYEPNNPPVVDDTGSTQEGIQEVVDANNQFAFDLYHEFDSQENGNMFYSPYSISTALVMTYEGAKGQTADEISSVFHFPEKDILRPNSAAIYNGLNEKNQEYELKTGNALWAQYDYEFLDEYMNNVEKYYGGKATNLDFAKETEKSRQTINSFIEEQTNGKIKDLIPKEVLSPMTRLVLTNAIYFKGTWEWEFDKSDTQERDFKITPENVVKTEMMHMSPDEANFNYMETEKMQMIELPYKGDELSMLILLPRQEKELNWRTGEIINYNYSIEDIEFNYEKFNEYKSEMKETNLDSIYLPKFEFDSKYFMAKNLENLGMPKAFIPGGADFSGMDGTNYLFISDVIHQAYVKVDEQGTEAAAATAVVMEITSAGPEMQPPTFNADHPFIFIIQEKDTGNILFLGKVNDPTQGLKN
jgi:serine protease inhibitor